MDDIKPSETRQRAGSQPGVTGAEGVAQRLPILPLALISLTHLAHGVLGLYRPIPSFRATLSIPIALGLGYGAAVWFAPRHRRFHLAANLIVGEDLGALAAGLTLGFPWASYVRPGAPWLIALQLIFAFVELARRRRAGAPLAPAWWLAGFLVAYAAVYTAYSLLEPGGLWVP